MAKISLQNIRKVYPGGVEVVPKLNLEIADKEFVVLVGPSGCGKSTTLRMIAGLEEITDGDMYIGERRVNDVAPKDRNIAMVFQNYALYPHMTVYKNMAFGLSLQKMPKDEIDRKVHEVAKILDLEHLLNRKPKALSGGQRQRVALGRAMVRDPDVFLLDEPMASFNPRARRAFRVVRTSSDRSLGLMVCRDWRYSVFFWSASLLSYSFLSANTYSSTSDFLYPFLAEAVYRLAVLPLLLSLSSMESSHNMEQTDL